MEAFTAGVPNNWTTTTPGAVTELTALGRIHSGNSCVSLTNGATLSQTVENIKAGCSYELSFFAHGEGVQVGFTATVTFVTPTGNVPGSTITVRQEDLMGSEKGFAYFRTVAAAPAGATSAIITFTAAADGTETLDLDDVSLSIR